MSPQDPVSGGGGWTGPGSWSARSPVPSAMLNPSLLAVVLRSAAAGHRREASAGMPWALSFVIAPLVLHRGSRDALPTRISTHLPTWVSRESSIRAGFPLRATSLVEPVREGLRFGLRHGVLSLAGDRLEPGRLLRSTLPSELDELIRKSTFVGRWMTKLDHPSTAFALLGVRV